MKYIPITVILILLFASLFGYVEANEIHKNGFGGITPFNTTGLTVFNDTIKRSTDFPSSSLVLSADFSILESNGDIKDFSIFNNDLTAQNDAPSTAPEFVDGTFRTSLETVNGGPSGGQWAEAAHSQSLDMTLTDLSMVWWGQFRHLDVRQYIQGKTCASLIYVYGMYIDSNNQLAAVVDNSACSSSQLITSGLPSGGLSVNRTYGIGVVFEDTPSGANVSFWLDGVWIYNEISTVRVGDSNSVFRVGRSRLPITTQWCNCNHDETLVFNEALDNSTMRLITTQQHDIVIKSGPGTTAQGFGGLFLALPWLIVFGLLGWLFFTIFMAWKKAFD